jgi:hypothetical protein
LQQGVARHCACVVTLHVNVRLAGNLGVGGGGGGGACYNLWKVSA